MVLMGTQETNIVEVRTQKTSLELPFTTTEKESEEVLVSRAQDVTADGLKDKGKLEDKVRRMKEEISLDMLGFKSKEVGQQQKWIKTQELAIEEASQGQTGPFSVEGLTCAKLMIDPVDGAPLRLGHLHSGQFSGETQQASPGSCPPESGTTTPSTSGAQASGLGGWSPHGLLGLVFLLWLSGRGGRAFWSLDRGLVGGSL